MAFVPFLLCPIISHKNKKRNTKIRPKVPNGFFAESSARLFLANFPRGRDAFPIRNIAARHARKLAYSAVKRDDLPECNDPCFLRAVLASAKELPQAVLIVRHVQNRLAAYNMTASDHRRILRLVKRKSFFEKKYP